VVAVSLDGNVYDFNLFTIYEDVHKQLGKHLLVLKSW
jgi:hypothetical protein